MSSKSIIIASCHVCRTDIIENELYIDYFGNLNHVFICSKCLPIETIARLGNHFSHVTEESQIKDSILLSDGDDSDFEHEDINSSDDEYATDDDKYEYYNKE